MKFTISKTELVDSLKTVSKGLSSRTTLPILSGILIVCEADGSVTFQSTDLEVSVRHTVSAFVAEAGRIVIPGKLFIDAINSLPDAAIELELENKVLSIDCMHSSFKIRTLDADDFPKFPEVTAEKTVSVPSQLAASMVRQVSKAVSRDESRAILTGILFSIEGSTLKFVATDSYRLAIRETQLDTTMENPFEVVVPGRIFDEVMKSAASSEAVTVGMSDNQILVSYDKTTFVTRRIEGNYPNYKQLLPKEVTCSARFSTEELLSAVRRMSLFGHNQAQVTFKISAEDQNVEVSSNAADVGAATEDIMAQVEGESSTIAFNAQYLIDGLTSVHTEEVLFEVQSSNRPGVFKATDSETFIYLAMPVRVG